MKKRIMAAAVSSVMLLSSISSFAASSGFTDLTENHLWAEPQIIEMTTTGIIKGYTDGSFRPDQSITKTEALVLTARVAGFISKDYDDFKIAAYNRYKEVLKPYQTPYPDEVAYLLYKGLLTESDLPGYIAPGRADTPLLRYEMAVLIAKVMRAEDQLNKTGNFTYTYADAGQIPFEAASSVEYVTNENLMMGLVDIENTGELIFNPNGSVSRAQVAVLLHRIMAKQEITVNYHTLLGKNVKNNTLTYRDETGKTNLFPIKDSFDFYVDGYKTDNVKNVQSGAKLAFFYINGVLCDVEIANDEDNRWNGVEETVTSPTPTAPVEGVVTTIVLSDKCSVVVNDVEYTLSAASSIYVNHVASTVYDLRVGQNIKLEFVNGKVIMAYATSPSGTEAPIVTTEGIITKLNLTSRRANLEVENTQTGETSEKLLIIETGAAIYNGISGQSIDFLSLEIDDRIIATGTIEDDGNFYASKIIVK